jgi:hypothetical protein
MISDWLGGQFPVLKPLFGYSLVSMSRGGIIHALLCEIDLGFWAFVLWPLAVCKLHLISGLALEGVWLVFVAWAGSKGKPEPTIPAGTVPPSETG